MAIFGPKPLVNPFGNMSISRLFHFLVFVAQKGFFSFQNIVKDIFLAYIALKKMLEKWPFLDQYYGLTHFEKYKFFDFLKFLFLQPKRRFFVLQYRKRHFPGLYCLKKKLEKWPFLDQNDGLTPLKKCHIFGFLNVVFLQPRKGFFRFRKS